MVLDSSAIVAIALEESASERLMDAIDQAEIVVVGAPTLLETLMVLNSRLGQDARPFVQDFLADVEAEVIEFGEAHFRSASAAFTRFGKGIHPAGLNFGDCMSYAIADIAGMSLLFTGEDFSKTDVRRAKY